MLLTEGFLGWLSRFKLIRLRRISLATLRRDGLRGGWVACGMGGFAEWVDGVMGLRVGFININDMYNNDVGKGGARGCEVHEVK
jgi:hypothetical protein